MQAGGADYSHSPWIINLKGERGGSVLGFFGTGDVVTIQTWGSVSQGTFEVFFFWKLTFEIEYQCLKRTKEELCKGQYLVTWQHISDINIA